MAIAVVCCATAPFPVASAQEPQVVPVVPVATKRCTCGRWTCPACQQQAMRGICPPGQVMPYAPGMQPMMPMAPIVPGAPPTGAMPAPSPGAAPPSAAGQPQAPTLSPESNMAANQLAPSAAQDLQSTLAQTGSQQNFMALNTGGVADPAMVGDFYGPAAFGPSTIMACESSDNYFSSPTPDNCTRYDIVVPSSSFALQRMKIAENTSPVPQNRIFMNYSMFDNVPLTSNGITVNRLSPGFESLLFSPSTSFEMRTPFATTLDSNIFVDSPTNTNKVEFGNLYFNFKQVLFRSDRSLLSTGLASTAPTADDVRVRNSSGTEIVRIKNQSVHLMPFLGFYAKPTQRTFFQGFTQVDVDANGSSVYFNNNVSRNNLNKIGKMQDMTLMYVDISGGYWVYRNRGRGLTGIAPMLEGHYNRSLNNADSVSDPSGTVINQPIPQFDNVNIVGALVFEFNRRSRLTFGYGAPIGNGTDRAFDNELRVTFNRYY